VSKLKKEKIKVGLKQREEVKEKHMSLKEKQGIAVVVEENLYTELVEQK